MSPSFRTLLDARHALLVFATPLEAREALSTATWADFGALAALDSCPPWTRAPIAPGIDLVITGVGKANAAAGVARTLDPARHALVLSLGIAGALPTPDEPDLAIGTTVVAEACVFADEGIATPSSFVSMSRAGFPPRNPNASRWSEMSYCVDPAVLESITTALGSRESHVVGPIATVSTCSGTDASARETQSRTRARAEAMEGAAIALVADTLDIRAAELRVISNSTGDRDRQVWNIREALDRLGKVLGLLFGPA